MSLFIQYKGGDDVIMCISNPKLSTVQRYYNNGKSTSIQANATLGLSNITVTNNNGILRCQFDRIKYISTTDGKYFSLFNTYYVLLAKGTLSGSKIY